MFLYLKYSTYILVPKLRKKKKTNSGQHISHIHIHAKWVSRNHTFSVNVQLSSHIILKTFISNHAMFVQNMNTGLDKEQVTTKFLNKESH